MRRLRWTAVAASLVLLAGCAPGSSTGGPVPSGAGASIAPAVTTPVLQIRHVGGFVGAAAEATRLPAVTVYADGRMFTPAPQIEIYPPPAMAALNVRQLSPGGADALVREAVAAGVHNGADFGRPQIADAPTTEVTAVTGAGTQRVDVMALTTSAGTQSGLTPAQVAARAKLAAFVRTVQESGSSGAVLYRPRVMAALVRPYTPVPDGAVSAPAAVRWPGPALPGVPLRAPATLTCVTVDGSVLASVLAAARTANALTPWLSGQRRWSIAFRPMLPHETGCGDLRGGAVIPLGEPFGTHPQDGFAVASTGRAPVPARSGCRPVPTARPAGRPRRSGFRRAG